jgi:glutathione S-transferase
MALKLYDLAGAEDERRFSPTCWRIKMALKHKGLVAEEIPWRFTEKEAIAFSNQQLVPVFVDLDQTIVDSWEIARYLETTYPDRPSLFGGSVGEAQALFIKFWCEQAIHPIVFRLILPDLFERIHHKDKEYFRSSREQRFGMTLEEIALPTESAIFTLNKTLEPLRATLECQPNLGGTFPSFADYIVFGAFQFARTMSPIKLLTPADPIYAWRDRLLDAFDGYARSSLGYDV